MDGYIVRKSDGKIVSDVIGASKIPVSDEHDRFDWTEDEVELVPFEAGPNGKIGEHIDAVRARRPLSGVELAIYELNRRLTALEGANLADTRAELDELLTDLKQTKKTNLQRAIDARYQEPEEAAEQPPEAIADLFQADRPFADQAKALWDKYNELTHLVQMKLATPEQSAKQSKLQGELDWIKRHAFEGV